MTAGHVVAFTGHRPDKLGGYAPCAQHTRVREALQSEIIALAPTWAISGMAQGVDQWAAQICVDLGIRFTAAIPFLGQETAWPTQARREYVTLLEKAFDVEVVAAGGFAAYKMQRRNEWMVDHCDTLVAVWDGSEGGTANCVRYAETVDRRVVRVSPA